LRPGHSPPLDRVNPRPRYSPGRRTAYRASSHSSHRKALTSFARPSSFFSWTHAHNAIREEINKFEVVLHHLVHHHGDRALADWETVALKVRRVPAAARAALSRDTC